MPPAQLCSKAIRTKTRAVPAWGVLAFLIAASAVARALLALHFAQNPSIMPDESLYLNLMRSLWLGGETALRGQPVTYDSLLYPLLLSPLNLLPRGIDLYRAVLCANAGHDLPLGNPGVPACAPNCGGNASRWLFRR